MGKNIPGGEFPKGEELDIEDKSTILEIGKYSITSIAMYMIEFDILKNHPEILEDYYKRLYIPGAVNTDEKLRRFIKVFLVRIYNIVLENKEIFKKALD